MAVDWRRAWEANWERLLPILAELLALMPEGAETVVTRALRRTILALLRPAESAARRILFIAMRGIVVEETDGRSRSGRSGKGGGGGALRGIFHLFDPRLWPGRRKRRTVAGHGPNVRGLDGSDDPVPPPAAAPTEDDLLDGAALRRRIDGLAAAMADVPGLARMLARGTVRWKQPMRPGRPPGYRARGRLPVHEVLDDVNHFAWLSVREPPS